MMDLYSFDLTYEKSFETYEKVTTAYQAIFNDLGLEITMAEASSGDMGGDLSHEWHAALPNGSDTIFVCKEKDSSGSLAKAGCGYAANDEVATTQKRPPAPMEGWSTADVVEWRGVTKDRKTLVRAWLYKSQRDMTIEDINIHTLKSLVPDLDTSISGLAWRTGDETVSKASHMVDIVDSRLSAQYEAKKLPPKLYQTTIGGNQLSTSVLDLSKYENKPDLMRISQGDQCPRCKEGFLSTNRSMEMGHTFYLGTRYTEPLNAKVTSPGNKITPLHMGCYGIGVSRLMGTIAEVQSQKNGQQWSWPVAIAPFQVIVIPVGDVTQDVLDFYDTIQNGVGQGRVKGRSPPNVVLDDRQRSFGWKMKDAEMFGVPITIVLGKGWKDKGEVEWRCESTGPPRKVPVGEAGDLVDQTLYKLANDPW